MISETQSKRILILRNGFQIIYSVNTRNIIYTYICIRSGPRANIMRMSINVSPSCACACQLTTYNHVVIMC